MTHPHKVKGNNFERWIVNKLAKYGFPAKRAYASDGRSLGQCKEVDVQCHIDGQTYTIQAKARKHMADWMKPPDDVDFCVIKEDYEKPLIVMPFDKFLSIVESITMKIKYEEEE